jgi:hypothetical protein
MERNFGLFQNNDRFEFRMRTTATDNNGIPSIITDAETVNLSPIHLVYTHSADDTTKFFINGELENKMFLGGTFNNWDSTFALGIANEFIENKPWFGTYYLTAIYSRALTNNEIYHNYERGVEGYNNINQPDQLSGIVNTDGNVDLDWADNSDNETGFRIFRKSQEEAIFEIIGSVEENIVSFIDTSSFQGTKNYYKISAFNDFRESQYSNSIVVVTPLPGPTDLSGQLTNEGFVQLNWSDNSESELGFIIEGKPQHQDSVFSIIDSVINNIKSYIDTEAKYYTPYIYRIYAFTSDTISDFSNEISINVVGIQNRSSSLKNDFNLSQNYPNPFNPITKINYLIPEKSSVSITIYTSLGEPVEELINSSQEKGEYCVNFDASELSSGVYFYRLKAVSIKTGKEFNDAKKLLLLK